MLTRVPPSGRALAALLGLAIYTVPLAVGALAELRHAAYHVLHEARQLEQMAAALGAVHFQERTTPAVPRGFVHEHDGTVHAHDAGTDAALRASEEANDDRDAAAAQPLDLASHLPADVTVASFGPRALLAPTGPLPTGARSETRAPAPPPPRA